jgi:hypothetical protein
MENKLNIRPDPDLNLMDQIQQVLRYHHYLPHPSLIPIPNHPHF